MFDWTELVTFVTAVVPALSEQRRARDAHVEETVMTFRQAYYATLKYEAGLAEGEAPSRQAELDLALAWENVATRIRRYDECLFNRMRLKGHFWRDGAGWSEETMRHARIGLERVRQDAEFKLLVEQLPPRR